MSFFFLVTTAPLVGWLSERILTKLFPPKDICSDCDDWIAGGIVIAFAYVGIGSLFFIF